MREILEWIIGLTMGMFIYVPLWLVSETGNDSYYGLIFVSILLCYGFVIFIVPLIKRI